MDLIRLYYIKDKKGNYYRIGRNNQLVKVTERRKAVMLPYLEAMSHVGKGKKALAYNVVAVEDDVNVEIEPFNYTDWKFNQKISQGSLAFREYMEQVKKNPVLDEIISHTEKANDNEGVNVMNDDNDDADILEKKLSEEQNNVNSSDNSDTMSEIQENQENDGQTAENDIQTASEALSKYLDDIALSDESYSGGFVKNAANSLQEILREESTTPAIDTEIANFMSNINWIDWLGQFIDITTRIGAYRDELDQTRIELDQKICDLLHYIEFEDISEDDAKVLTNIIKICREKRRFLKDQIICVDTIKNALATTLNINKAKNALKALGGLTNRQYQPRIYQTLFEKEEQ